METSADYAVIIDTTLTPQLIEEGYVREVVSKVQTMRKEAGFEVTDHIRLYAAGNGVIENVINQNSDLIAGETLSDEVVYRKNGRLCEGLGYQRPANNAGR